MGLAFKLLMARAKNLIAKKLQGKRILIVEDQPMVSKLLTELLGSYKSLVFGFFKQGRIGTN
jgi:hypothetical protein